MFLCFLFLSIFRPATKIENMLDLRVKLNELDDLTDVLSIEYLCYYSSRSAIKNV